MRVRVVATLQRGALTWSEPLDEQNAARVAEGYWQDRAERDERQRERERAHRRSAAPPQRLAYSYEPKAARMVRLAVGA